MAKRRSVGDFATQMILGGGPSSYNPDQQAAYSKQYPGLEWRDGVPYTASQTPDTPEYSGPNAQYSGLTGREDAPGSMVEADLTNPNIWSQLGRFALTTSAGKALAGQFGGAGGGAVTAMGNPTAGVSFLPGAVAGGPMASPMAGVSFLGGSGGAASGGALTGSGVAAGAGSTTKRILSAIGGKAAGSWKDPNTLLGLGQLATGILGPMLGGDELTGYTGDMAPPVRLRALMEQLNGEYKAQKAAQAERQATRPKSYVPRGLQ